MSGDNDGASPSGRAAPDGGREHGDHARTFEEARREAQRTLDAQSQMVARMDRKAVLLLQFTASLLMVVATVTPAVVGSGLAPGALFNAYVVACLAVLLVAAACAGVCYTLTNQYDGIGASGIDETVDENYDVEVFRERLLLGYANWIRRNRVTNARKTPLVTTSLLCIVVAVAMLLLGMLRAFVGPVPTPVLGVVGVALLGVVAASRLHKQIRQWYALTRSDETPTGEVDGVTVEAFRGEPVTTGDVREDPEWFDGEDD
ncbi:hypothetical protein [Halarchaeum sp. P4]|uniref:hypothetical protein n=1 Tax=Halarchaeum sp. P4 TaxID=3421639 RepID=UPI003EC0E277